MSLSGLFFASLFCPIAASALAAADIMIVQIVMISGVFNNDVIVVDATAVDDDVIDIAFSHTRVGQGSSILPPSACSRFPAIEKKGGLINDILS